MTKPNFTFKVVVLFVLCFYAAAGASFAQSNARSLADTGYDVVLQILVGSNDAGQKSIAPAGLSAVVKKINNNFSFSNYRLANTYISRVADTGGVEYKSLANDFGQTVAQDAPIFTDWSFAGLKDAAANAPASNSIQIQSFRFGARVPVRMANNVVNYENIGLSLVRIGLSKNAPTLIGTLPTTKNGEAVFLILTVKPVED